MPQYINKSRSPLVIKDDNGALMTIAPGATVELQETVARRGMPYLSPLSGPQLLIESPLPVSEAGNETFEQNIAEAEQPQPKKKRKKNTTE